MFYFKYCVVTDKDQCGSEHGQLLSVTTETVELEVENLNYTKGQSCIWEIEYHVNRNQVY